MRPLLAIARLTVLEALRNKLLILLGIFVLGVLIVSQFVEYLTLGEQAKIFKDLALGLLYLFTSILAIVLPCENFHQEQDRNSLAAVLAKPLGRATFLGGKFLGMALLLLLVTAAMGCLSGVLLAVRGAAWDINIVKACMLAFCHSLILASFSLAFGVILSGTFLGVICGISIYLIGHLLEPLREWLEHAQAATSKTIAMTLLYLVPHLENLAMQDSVALGEFVPWAYIAQNVVYAGFYTAVILAIGCAAFSRKDY